MILMTVPYLVHNDFALLKRLFMSALQILVALRFRVFSQNFEGNLLPNDW